MAKRTVIGDETEKLDNRPAKGLLGEVDSLSYRVHELEKHIHNKERWFGLAAAPVGETHRADIDSMTPFQIDAGNDDWGPWLQIIGSDDTPIIPGNVKFDLHRLLITEVETDEVITRIQIAFDSSAAAALAAGNYTEIMAIPEKDTKNPPFEIKLPRMDIGTKVWVRGWGAGQDTHTVDFFIGIHGYPG